MELNPIKLLMYDDLVGTPSAFGPELAYRLRVAQPTLTDGPIHLWYTIILLPMFVYLIFYDLSALVGCWSSFSTRRIIYKFKCVFFWLHCFCGKWEGWTFVNRFNHTSGVTVVTPTDRPKSVRNRCVSEVFCGVFGVVTFLFGCICGCS